MGTEFLINVGISKAIPFVFSKRIEDISLSGSGYLEKVVWCHFWDIKILSMSTMNNLEFGLPTNDWHILYL